MKKMLCALLLLLSGWASAQNTTVNVTYMFTPGAAAYVYAQGRTLASYAGSLTSSVNGLYLGSGVNVTVNTTGAYTSPRCCGGATHFWGYGDEASALDWASKDIDTALTRVPTNTDITVVVADFDPGDGSLDFGGASRGRCSLGTRTPENAFVGINVRWQDGNPYQDVLAHELGHQLCMDDAQGWYRKTGSTPQDCEVRWTIEYGGGNSALRDFPSYQTACWKVVAVQSSCYTSGHASIAQIAAASGCTAAGGSQTGGTGIGAHWNETITCSGGGTSNWQADYVWNTTNAAFTCTNAMLIPYFGGATLPSQYASGGTLVRNSVAAMNTQAALTAAFRNANWAIWRAKVAKMWATLL